MEAQLIFVVFLLAISTTRAFYLSLKQRKEWAEARDFCAHHGMSLPILPTEDDFELFWKIVSNATLSDGEDVSNSRVWLGVRHDGSLGETAEHFTWLDGTTSTYVTLDSHDLETIENGTSPACVRAFNGRWKLTDCEWDRPVVCQGNFQTLTNMNTPKVYTKVSTEHDEGQTHTRYLILDDVTSLPASLNLCGLTPAAVDMVDCFQLCAFRSHCSYVILLSDHSNCFVQC